MSNSTSLPDGEATPAARLIVKAAVQWINGPKDTRADLARARAKLLAYGEVADDVLGIAQTPFAFTMAVRDSIEISPHPHATTGSAARAAALREEWQRALVADVLDRLGAHGASPSP